MTPVQCVWALFGPANKSEHQIVSRGEGNCGNDSFRVKDSCTMMTRNEQKVNQTLQSWYTEDSL
jgi:hypothetical protein